MSVTASKANSSTGQTFLTAFSVNAAALGVQLVAFIILKNRLTRIYGPRTYLPPADKRASPLPKGIWRWLPAILRSSSQEIIHKNGLDAYMFLRFLKMLIWIFLVFTFFTWAILIPVDAVNITNSYPSLDQLSWSNISGGDDDKRYAAHIVMVYLLTFFVLFMIRREMEHFIHMRHQFLISKSHSRLPQARTVLITSVPEELANDHDLRMFASFVPGGVDRVWIYRDTKALNDFFAARTKACKKLEKAEASLLRNATLEWRKRTKAQKKAKAKQHDPEKLENGSEDLKIPETPTHDFLNDLVPLEKRPKHRTGLMGLLGKKVDTIDWCKDEIARLNKELQSGRDNYVQGKFLGSVFIRCNLQMGAHVLAQCVSYHEPLAMYGKFLEANPKDVVWENLDDGAAEMQTRYVLSWLANIGLIFAWTFPVAFVGTLSQIDDLCSKVSWLRWICTSPTPVPGIIQGVLPPLILAILFIILPMILRALAWYECIPRYSLISISVYKRYFFFLLFNGFIIVTLASSVTTTIEEIVQAPTHAVQQLASRLPGASLFFMTYLATQGLAGAGQALVQLVPLIMYLVRKWFLGRTPRQAFSVTFMMPSADFGVVLPQLSLLATIAFAYSVISPIINGLALLSFCLFYFAWKFLLTQVFDQPDESETGGLYFPMAITNLFVGLYIEQICLACLFFLKISENRVSSIVEGCLMILLLVITAGAQYLIGRSYAPITDYLPMSLAMKKMEKKHAQRKLKLQQRLAGVTEELAEDIDIFSRDRIRSVRRRLKLLPSESKDGSNKKHGEHKSTSSDKASDSDREKSSASDPTPTEEAVASGASVKGVISEDGTAKDGHPNLFRQPSGGSSHSQESKASKKPGDAETSNELETTGQPDIYKPAQPIGDFDTDSDIDEEDDDNPHAFDHPSTYVEQPWIWVPKDSLGLSEMLIGELKAVGVDASNLGSSMDEKGVVEVARNPPDEEWDGGHDQ